MLWSLALHHKDANDKPFIHGLSLIEREANDDRNFVRKAISMALRAVGRRNAELAQASLETAERLRASELAPARWVGNDALKTLRRA